jgi:hypothetical protein
MIDDRVLRDKVFNMFAARENIHLHDAGTDSHRLSTCHSVTRTVCLHVTLSLCLSVRHSHRLTTSDTVASVRLSTSHSAPAPVSLPLSPPLPPCPPLSHTHTRVSFAFKRRHHTCLPRHRHTQQHNPPQCNTTDVRPEHDRRHGLSGGYPVVCQGTGGCKGCRGGDLQASTGTRCGASCRHSCHRERERERERFMCSTTGRIKVSMCMPIRRVCEPVDLFTALC